MQKNFAVIFAGCSSLPAKPQRRTQNKLRHVLYTLRNYRRFRAESYNKAVRLQFDKFWKICNILRTDHTYTPPTPI